jgi:hypothetical protein
MSFEFVLFLDVGREGVSPLEMYNPDLYQQLQRISIRMDREARESKLLASNILNFDILLASVEA